jgi:hypothetical protein
MSWIDDLNNQADVGGGMNNRLSWNKYAQQQLQSQIDAQKQGKGKKKGFWTDQISTGGGIGGALGGAAAGAAIGSVVPIAGTAVGGLLGAIIGGGLGSAAGELGENAIVGEKDLSKNVLKEGLIGGATSIPLGAGFKLARAGGSALLGNGAKAGQLVAEAGAGTIPKMAGGLQAKAALEAGQMAAQGGSKGVLQKAGLGLENQGKKLLGTQANLTRAEARKIGQLPENVLGDLNKRTGLTSLDDMAQVGMNVTGKNGAYSELTRNAIGNTPGVDLGDIRTVGENLIADNAPLLTGLKKQAVLDQIKNNAVKAYGGSEGSLNALANPLEALDVANNFRKMARDIASRPTLQASDGQLASVYNNLAKTIEDRLYSAPGLDDGLKLARGDRASELASLAASAPNRAQGQAYERLAQELQGIDSVKALRGAQKPFVGLSKIDEATARAAGGAGAQLGDNVQGLGRMVQKPANLLALPLNAATPKVGGAMANMGRSLQGMGAGSTGAGQSVFGAGIRQAGGRLLTGNDMGTQPEQPSLEEVMLAQAQSGQLGPDSAAQDPMQDPSVQAPTNPFGVSRDEVGQALMKAMQANDKTAVSQLQDLYSLVSDYEDSQNQSSSMNATTQKALAQSANADTTLTQLEQLLNNAGGAGGPVGGNISSFLGNMGLNGNAKTYNDLANGSVTQIAKALGETGAMSDSDRIAYQALLPKITDTAEVAANKFAALRARMAAAHQNTLQYGAGLDPTLEQALNGAGY